MIGDGGLVVGDCGIVCGGCVVCGVMCDVWWGVRW